jgi:hypothetical protein
MTGKISEKRYITNRVRLLKYVKYVLFAILHTLLAMMLVYCIHKSTAEKLINNQHGIVAFLNFFKYKLYKKRIKYKLCILWQITMF